MSGLEPGFGLPPDGPLPGPPYQPQVAILGLIPNVRVDVPICIVLIVFFFAGAALNLAIFIRNKAIGHKFLPSMVLVTFCLTRIIALSLRIAWATQFRNVSLNIAATIFAAAGVVLLFILNLLFTHRLLRALHPNFGWHPFVGYFFLFLYFLAIVCLICVLTATIVSYYTLVYDYLWKCHEVQVFASTTMALLAFLPIPILLVAVFYPGSRRPEPFGYGSLTTKVVLVLLTATLLTIGAAYRCAVSYTIRPLWAPAWWHHKACYYIFNYDLELVVIFTYALMRFDLRFHVPDGARKRGDYLKGLHAYSRVSSMAVVHHGFPHISNANEWRERTATYYGTGSTHYGNGSTYYDTGNTYYGTGTTYYDTGSTYYGPGSTYYGTATTRVSRSAVIRGLSELGDSRGNGRTFVSEETVERSGPGFFLGKRSRGRSTRQDRGNLKFWEKWTRGRSPPRTRSSWSRTRTSGPSLSKSGDVRGNNLSSVSEEIVERSGPGFFLGKRSRGRSTRQDRGNPKFWEKWSRGRSPPRTRSTTRGSGPSHSHHHHHHDRRQRHKHRRRSDRDTYL